MEQFKATPKSRTGKNTIQGVEPPMNIEVAYYGHVKREMIKVINNELKGVGTNVKLSDAIPSDVSEVLSKLGSYHTKVWHRRLKGGSTVSTDVLALITVADLEPIILRGVQDSVQLIQGLQTHIEGLVQELILSSVVTDSPAETLREGIKRVTKVSDYRAKLIARDQVSKVTGSMTRVRHTQAGISSYEWSTSKDGRVRPSHRDNNGKVFRWDAPPATGHPTDDIQCRCVALGVVNYED